MADRALDYLLGKLDTFHEQYDDEKATTLDDIARVRESLLADRWHAAFLLRDIARLATKVADELGAE
jgi:hypothetical protein